MNRRAAATMRTEPIHACILGFGAAAILLTASAASAGSAQGCAAYLRGDYSTALREFLPDAIKGEASAQLAVG
jgi:hypothetical protein